MTNGNVFLIRRSLLMELESLPELEVQLPARIVLVESVRVIQAERPKRRHEHDPHARASVEACGIDLADAAPDVTRVVEERCRDVVVEAYRVLGAHAQVRIAEA